jgi:hypothetical protein
MHEPIARYGPLGFRIGRDASTLHPHRQKRDATLVDFARIAVVTGEPPLNFQLNVCALGGVFFA